MNPRVFLFVLWEGGGTNPPELAIAARLVARGHVVRVLGDPCMRSDVAAAGATLRPFRVAPHRATRTADTEIIRDWAAWTPLGAFARARDRHAFGPAKLFAREVLETLEEFPADAVVVDAMLFGGLVGAEASGRPYAALIPMTSFLPAAGRPPPALGLRPAQGPLGRLRDRVLWWLGDELLWRSCLAPLNAARRSVGLGPVAHPLDQIRRADRVLVLTSPAFDFAAPERDGNVCYVGPELDDPAWATGAGRPVLPTGPGPLILVSLSMTYQGQEPLLRRIVSALAPLPVRAVVTTGPALDPDDFPAPAHIRMVQAAPHSALLPHCALVITHGGHGTVLRALSAGVPVLCLPMGRDQADDAARIVAAHAGCWLSSHSAVGTLRKAVTRALADRELRAGAKRIAAQLSAERHGDLAVTELEQLAGVRRQPNPLPNRDRFSTGALRGSSLEPA